MNKCVLQEWPETEAKWNELSLEKKIQLLFYDEWLEDIHPEKLWYHYTSIDALQTMLTDKGVELWASHGMYVNDKEEIIYGAKYIAELMKKVVSQEKVMHRYEGSTYLACLSLERDSIPMWNTYGGNGCGITLGFKPHIPSDASYQCMRVIYEGTKAETEWFNKSLRQLGEKNKLDQMSGILNILYLPLAFKSYGFVYEKEIRLISMDKSPIYFRTRKNLIVPYRKIYVDYQYLSEIMIGPSADANRMEYAIKLLLQQKGIKGVKVVHSTSPLRN